MTDDLYYTYLPNSNQVSSITDSAEPSDLYDVKEYHDNGVGETDMLYDAKGNLIYDADRGIAAIRYNRLNLPDTIQFANGNQIVNWYDATGYKYKTIYYTVLTTAIVPDYTVAHYGFDSDTVHYRIVAYDGNIETTYTLQDTIRRVFNAEGYAQQSTGFAFYNDSLDQSIPHFYYYYKDHLGNICAVKDMTADTVVQHTFFYPSGVPMALSDGQSVQPYKYNGKEYIEMYGLDEYDISARHYYATIVRTTTLDPLAEQYYHLSPYSWCGNNNIANIDETGSYFFDWDEKVYRSSYGEHEIVSWDEVFDNHFHETPPNKYATAGTLLYEFFTGNGESKRDFYEEDGFAQKFIQSSAIQEIYSDVAKQIFLEGKNQGEANIKLRNKERRSIFRRDIKTIFSLGRNGNINETILGSFETNWELQYFDSNGNAIVKITAFNEMSAKSFFRNPIYGYTFLWKKYISQPIDRIFENGLFGTGAMKTTSQTISWTITIKKPK